MKQNPPIVCVGFPRWEGGDYLKSTVQLMQVLAERERVLYVDYPYTYLDVWRARKGQVNDVPLAALTDPQQRLQQLSTKGNGALHLLRLPPFIPANFLRSNWLYDLTLNWNGRKTKVAITKALKQLRWESPIVINAFNPALGNALANKLGEQKLAYYCYDEISAAPWIARHGARHEEQFLQKVDHTIVSSTGLYERKAPYTRQCTIVKNGVDLSLFQATAYRPDDLPSGSIIGYVGSVDDRLDYNLLQAIAVQLPTTQLVFVGRIVAREEAEALAQLPNVHLLGPKPPEQLGAYVGNFTLGIIPFVKNELTAGIYPLKINEYLALGLAVVSTHFADLSEFTTYCTVCEDTNAFVANCANALSTSSVDEIRERRAFAAQNSWHGRADALAHALGLVANIPSPEKALANG